MVLKYFFARLKHNLGLTIGGTIAILLVCFMLIVAAAMPSVLENIMLGYNKQLYGNADIMLTNGKQTEDRFLGLALLREDKVLMDNAEYINGFFGAVGEIDFSKGKNQCTLIFADFENQNEYNPIISAELPEKLTDSEIIVSEAYAEKHDIKTGDEVKITFLEKEKVFSVVCIAENSGPLGISNTIFLSSKAMSSRFSPLLPSRLVTHCFIKPKNMTSLAIIYEHLANNYQEIEVRNIEQVDETRFTSVPMTFISIIIVFFCFTTLIILLRFIFNSDKSNFDLFRMLGMSENKIRLISLLSTFLMCFVAFLVVIPLVVYLEDVMKTSSPLFENLNIGIFPFITGTIGALIIGVSGTLISIRTPNEIKYKNNNESKATVLLLIRFVFFVLIAIISYFIVNTSKYIGLIMVFIGLIGVVVTLPRTIEFLYKNINKLPRSIYRLRLRTMAGKPEWQKFVLFTIMAVIIVLLLVTSMHGLRISMVDSLARKIDVGQGISKTEIMAREFILAFFFELLWIMDIFCWGLIILTAVTVTFMTAIRRSNSKEETKQLIPLGLKKTSEIKHNAYCIVFGILPAIIMAPLIVLLLCRASTTLFALFEAKTSLIYSFSTILVGTIIAFVTIFTIELVLCIFYWRQSERTIRGKNI